MQLFNNIKKFLWLVLWLVRPPSSAKELWDMYAKSWKAKPGAEILGEEWGNWQVFGEKMEQYIKPEMKVLEIGCGGGKMSRIAAQICVDISKEMLKKAKVTLSSFKNVAFRKVKGCILNFQDNTFDFIFSHDVFVHFDPYMVYAYYLEIHRVLKPGGRCMISFYDLEKHFVRFKEEVQHVMSHPKGMGLEYGRIWFYDLNQIQKFVEDIGFKIVETDRRTFLIIIVEKV